MTTKKINDQLNRLLASELVLGQKIRNAHWNLISFHFQTIHEWLGELYNQVNGFADAIAERNRMLNNPAEGSYGRMVKLSHIDDCSSPLTNEETVFKTLLNDQTILIPAIQKAIRESEKNKDYGTADFLTGLLREHEKMQWFLKSSLPKNK